MKAQKHKHYKFTNPLMFAIVMEDEARCIELLNRIIPERRVKAVRFPDREGAEKSYRVTSEKAIITKLDAKSVRLDVLFEDDDAWTDIELQVEYIEAFPKRVRYYHALLAMKSLKRGNHYSRLKPCYVIFICLFDPIGTGEPVYHIRSRIDGSRFLASSPLALLGTRWGSFAQARFSEIRDFESRLKMA